MSEPLEQPPLGRRVLMRVAMTLAAWSVAFLIVLALLSLFGSKLESLPHALNALVFTGVLVPIMGNLVMPVLNSAIARWLAHPPPRPPESGSGPDPEVRSERAHEDDRVRRDVLAPSREV